MKARLPQGMGGGPQNMQAMMQQARKMQEQMEQTQAALEAREYEIASGGGAVRIVINGKKEITSLTISPELVDPDDVETLSDVLTAAFNEAVKKVESTANEEMGKITGDLSLPGVF